MTPAKSKVSKQLSDININVDTRTNTNTNTKVRTKATIKSRSEKDFENIIEKCKSEGWLNVIDFLKDKATNSTHTTVNYWMGIKHLNDFLKIQYHDEYDAETIIQPIKQERIDIYELLRLFKQYLLHEAPNHSVMSVSSVISYIKQAKSYFLFSDIDIIDHKFRARVKMPQLHKEDEQPIDSNDVIEIIHHIDNRRLKAYVLLLASSGCRAVEALALREQDIDWSGIDFTSNQPKDMLEPARIHVRKEYTKTRRARDIFISNEAARYLNDWLEWKYRFQKPTPAKARADAALEGELVFARVGRGREADPARMYTSMACEFGKVLDKIKSRRFGTRKNDGNNVIPRRLITLHSFRRFVKTIIETHSSESYSEWFLGHAKSSYWVKKPEELRSIYREDIMQYLTFLDYPTLEATGKNLESQLKDKDKQIQQLKQRDSDNSQRITQLEGEVIDLYDQIKWGTERMKEATPKLKHNLSISEGIHESISTVAKSLNDIQKAPQMTDKEKLRHLLEAIGNMVTQVQNKTDSGG